MFSSAVSVVDFDTRVPLELIEVQIEVGLAISVEPEVDARVRGDLELAPVVVGLRARGRLHGLGAAHAVGRPGLHRTVDGRIRGGLGLVVVILVRVVRARGGRHGARAIGRHALARVVAVDRVDVLGRARVARRDSRCRTPGGSSCRPSSRCRRTGCRCRTASPRCRSRRSAVRRPGRGHRHRVDLRLRRVIAVADRVVVIVGDEHVVDRLLRARRASRRPGSGRRPRTRRSCWCPRS